MEFLICICLIFASPQHIEMIDQNGFEVSCLRHKLNSKVLFTISTNRTAGKFKLLLYKLENKKLVNEGTYPFMSDVKTKVTFSQLKGHFVLHILNVETDEIIIVHNIKL